MLIPSQAFVAMHRAFAGTRVFGHAFDVADSRPSLALAVQNFKRGNS
jgi:hypothetical protein